MRGAILGAATVAAALLLTGTACAAPVESASGGAPDGADALAGEWRLTAGSDADGPIRPGNAVVTLRVDERSAGGQAACNYYAAEVEGTTDDLTIRQVAHTAMACVQVGLMELESRYLDALPWVTSGEVRPGSLVLRGPGVELSYERISS
jgi:heat shock protein HslJ